MADNRVFGAVACPVCGCAQAVAKEMKSGVVVICRNEADGGCNTQIFGRSRTARGVIARKVMKWNDPDLRKEILGAAPAIEKAPKTKAPSKSLAAPAEPALIPEPSPEPTPPTKTKVLGGLLEW